MIARPCLGCGEPVAGSWCPDCQPVRVEPSKDRRARGYEGQWRKVSARARRLQPWCSDCGTDKDLTCDHSPEAWRRFEAGLAVRIVDVDVVCRSCNSKRGPARQRVDQGGCPAVGVFGTRTARHRGDLNPEGRDG